MSKNEWLRFWQKMRDAGFMLADAPARKIAVFANTSGQVVLAASEDGAQCVATVCVDEIELLEGLLRQAKAAALEVDAEHRAEHAIWCAKRGVGNDH